MAEEKRDYYEVLGLQKGCSDDELKKAYRKLAKQYHPDANGGDKAAEQQFIKINQAYDTLGDEKKRKEYDEMRENPFAGAGSAGGSPLKKFIMMIVLPMFTAPGSTRAQIVSSMPKYRIVMYVGIRPPLNIMVKMKIHAYLPRARNASFSLDRG